MPIGVSGCGMGKTLYAAHRGGLFLVGPSANHLLRSTIFSGLLSSSQFWNVVFNHFEIQVCRFERVNIGYLFEPGVKLINIPLGNESNSFADLDCGLVSNSCFAPSGFNAFRR